MNEGTCDLLQKDGCDERNRPLWKAKSIASSLHHDKVKPKYRNPHRQFTRALIQGVSRKQRRARRIESTAIQCERSWMA